MEKLNKIVKRGIKMGNRVWCVFGYNKWINYGKIVEEGSLAVKISSSEKQNNSPELWSNKPYFIKRFSTLEEALEEWFKSGSSGCNTLEDLTQEAIRRFPSYFNERNKKR